ncbi:hypothetical protein ABE488_00680 [Luteimonas sp. TWI662]|uniref:hypothetical protein n=1 Tax=Luteimonas sp. TWI662 TaxID=3136789 RepID=UPI00320A6DF6
MPTWDRHEVTPEAKALVRRWRAEARREREDREKPATVGQRVKIALFCLIALLAPFVLVALFFSLWGSVRL